MYYGLCSVDTAEWRDLASESREHLQLWKICTSSPRRRDCPVTVRRRPQLDESTLITVMLAKINCLPLCDHKDAGKEEKRELLSEAPFYSH